MHDCIPQGDGDIETHTRTSAKNCSAADGLWPLDEPEMPGVGYLQVTAMGYGIGDLTARCGGVTTSSAKPITRTGAVMLR
jgi:hypothetical protein